jgi:ribonuclease E
MEEQVQTRRPEEADEEAEADVAADADEAATDQSIEVTAEESGDQPNRKRRRRGKRGGRRRARPGIAPEVGAVDPDAEEALEPIYGESASQEGYDGQAVDATAASAVMDDDGAPIWSGRIIKEAATVTSEAAATIGEAVSIDEAQAVADVPGEALSEGEDSAEPGDATPRARRRSPRRSRAKRVVEAEAADAVETPASSVVAEPKGAFVGVPTDTAVPVPEMEIAEAVKEEPFAAAAERSFVDAEVRVPSPWSVSGDVATAMPPPQAESSPAEVSVLPEESSRDEPGESLADAERNRAHLEDEDRRAEEARRTEIIRVGEGSDQRDENPRRGWWQRLLT